jgi:FMN-dependent NADH-azoreductase
LHAAALRRWLACASNGTRETYLRSAFSFIGVTNLDVVAAEGLKVSVEQREMAIAQAERRIEQTIAALAA